MEWISLIIAVLSFAGLILKHWWDSKERERLAQEAYEKYKAEFEAKLTAFIEKKSDELKADSQKFIKVWDALDAEKKKSIEDVLAEEMKK